MRRGEEGSFDKKGVGEPAKYFDYESGVAEVEKRVLEELNSNGINFVVVAIWGDGPNVGKTTISRHLSHQLEGKNISVSGVKDLKNVKAIIDSATMGMPGRKKVLIIEAANVYSPFARNDQERLTLRENLESNIKGAIEPSIGDIGKIIHVGIIKDEPVIGENFPVTDIIIRNQHAQDKSTLRSYL